ncbi:MAG: DUF1579 domain-containing protein [Gemmataceae bacterium]
MGRHYTLRGLLIVAAAFGILAAGGRLSAQFPEPGPEHAMLKAQEGEWDAIAKSPAGDSKGKLSVKMALNGLWMLEHYEGEAGGVKFEGRGMTSYDPKTKKYVNVWVDSMVTRPMVTEGTFDKAKKTLTFKGEMPTPDGKMATATIAIQYKDANTKVLTLSAGAEGKDMQMVQITYTRRK